MNSKHRNLWLLAIVSVLLASSLACNLFSHRLIVPKPTETVPVTTEAAQELENNLQSGLDTFQSNGELTLSITEAQLTSLITQKLKEQPDIPIKDPQVYLRDGKIQFSATADQGNISMPLEVIIALGVDAQGMPTYQFLSAKVGPFPLPDTMIAQLSAQIDQILSAQLLAANAPVVLESITIADGVLTIKGHRR